MIYYFSGTGNSKWIAEETAAALHDQAADLLRADPKAHTFTTGEYLGVVFPVYYYAAPDVVLDFARQLEPNGAYTFAICDYSNITGHALQQFSRDALPLCSGYGLLMPDNTSVIGSSYDNEETTLDKLRTAPERLQSIIRRIQAREMGTFDSREGDNPEENTRVWPQKFREEHCFTAPFHVDSERCRSCGLCAKLCPAGAISMKEGCPVWVKDRCYYCMACINRCPAEAIEYGEKSKGVYRYTFDKYCRKLLSRQPVQHRIEDGEKRL